jgi:hypothetical protein
LPKESSRDSRLRTWDVEIHRYHRYIVDYGWIIQVIVILYYEIL